MAKERTSVRMQAQIKTLSEQGYSIRAIARILRLSRKTVRKFLESTIPAEEAPAASWVADVDWEYTRREVYGKGTTIKQIHAGQKRGTGYFFSFSWAVHAAACSTPDQTSLQFSAANPKFQTVAADLHSLEALRSLNLLAASLFPLTNLQELPEATDRSSPSGGYSTKSTHSEISRAQPLPDFVEHSAVLLEDAHPAEWENS
jgi:hypothetical protein